MSEKNIFFADASQKIIAEAPYNFISLASKICAPHDIWKDVIATKNPVTFENEAGEVEVDEKATKIAIKNIYQKYEEYIKKDGKHTGYIELEITTTRDTLVGMPRKEIDEKTREEKEISTFFSIKNNEPIIPGSSLRGMTRNLFKIMTASSFRTDEDFNNLILYYRDITGGNGYKELKDTYEENHYLGDEKNICGGFVVRIKDDAGNILWKVYKDPTFNVEGEKRLTKDIEKNYKPDDKNRNKSKELTYPIVEWDKFDDHSTCEILVKIIQNDNKIKVYTFNWNATNDDNVYVVDEKTIQGYLNDSRRKSVNLLYMDDKNQDDNAQEKGGAYITNNLAKQLNISGAELIAPCFFIADERTKKVKHFGHTKFYRIPYLLSIADHVPSNLKTQTVDFTDLVFGLKEFWGGRVYFGDAVHDKDASCSSDTNKTMKTILLGANPTSFQMYLTQKDDYKRAHWNTKESMIRGVKYYWQRNKIKEYNSTDSEEGNDKVQSILSNIVEKDNVFRSKVYFRELTDFELGALCKVLFTATGTSAKTPKGVYVRHKGRRFKIGKGKPMGLGTIKILSTLHLEGEETYNGDMWTEGGALDPIKIVCSEEENISEVDHYIQKFDEYVEKTMGDSIGTLEKSVEELYYMMSSNWVNDDFDRKLEYMPIEGDVVDPSRFKQRTALLEPKLFREFKG